MKKFTNSIVAKALLILIAISFVVVGGISGGLSVGGSVAHVKGESISFEEFYQSYRQQAQRTSLDPQLLQQSQYANIVLDQLIRNTISYATAKQTGIIATDASIAKYIQSVDAFQLNGTFDKAQYTAVLQTNGLSSDTYLDNVKKGNTATKYLNAFQTFTLYAPKSIDIISKNKHQKRTLVQAKKSMESIPTPVYTDTDIQHYYDTNIESFGVPETRNVTVLYLNQKIVADSISDTEAQKYFNENKSDFYRPETRTFYTIGGNDDALNAIRKAVRSGTHIKTAINNILKQDAETLKTENAKKSDVDESLQNTVFRLKQNTISPIVDGPFSNVVVFVEAITKAQKPVFTKAKADVKTQIAFEKIFDLSAIIEDEINQGTDPQTVAKAVNIPITTVDVTQTGLLSLEYGDNEAFLDAVFTTPEGDVSDLVDLGEDAFVATWVNTITPPYIPKLSQITSDVKTAFIQDKKQDILNTQLSTLATITDIKAFKSSARKQGFRINIFTNQKAEDITDSTLAQGFNIPIGSITTNPAQGTAIFALNRTLPDTVDKQDIDTLESYVTENITQATVHNIIDAFIKQSPAKINQKRVNSVYGG